MVLSKVITFFESCPANGKNIVIPPGRPQTLLRCRYYCQLAQYFFREKPNKTVLLSSLSNLLPGNGKDHMNRNNLYSCKQHQPCY